MATKCRARSKSIVSQGRIRQAILLIRGKKVLFDAHLAVLYDVETRVLVQAVKRNIERFPKDFMFQLTKTELSHLRSHSVTSSDWGRRRYPPPTHRNSGNCNRVHPPGQHRPHNRHDNVGEEHR